MKRSAVISPCGLYRYSLTREEGAMFASKTVLFVLNNPSAADADIDDPTVRRGWGYARAWGCNKMIFANTNPFRSTDPALAIVPPEEVLAENDTHLRFATYEADLVILAWGTKARPALASRALSVLHCQMPVHVLALSKDGIPKHPLYLKADLRPILFNAQLAGAAAGAKGGSHQGEQV